MDGICHELLSDIHKKIPKPYAIAPDDIASTKKRLLNYIREKSSQPLLTRD